jgi:hypothetical protein
LQGSTAAAHDLYAAGSCRDLLLCTVCQSPGLVGEGDRLIPAAGIVAVSAAVVREIYLPIQIREDWPPG